MTHIGLISDTHGLLDERVFEHFNDCDEVWHAGDVGSVTIIEQLTAFKPVRFVFGNIDSKEIHWQFLSFFSIIYISSLRAFTSISLIIK